MQFKQYDSYEDMMAEMRANEDAANARIVPEQREITYGSHWMRMIIDMGEYVPIFGRVLTQEEHRKTLEGVDPEEAESELEAYANSYERNYRFGMAYSVMCPEGEYGDTHISVMKPITKEQFEQAERLNWDLAALMDEMALWMEGVPVARA